MQLGAVLDTVIGISFVFFLLALASSAVAEWLATVLKKRAKYLLRGLRDMLKVPETDQALAQAVDRTMASVTGIGKERDLHSSALQTVAKALKAPDVVANEAAGGAQQAPKAPVTLDLSTFLSHQLVVSQVQTVAGGAATRLPSYIPARTFANVVLDAVLPDRTGATSIDRLRERLADDQGLTLPPQVRAALDAALKSARSSIEEVRTELEVWYDATMERVSGAYKRWSKRWLVVIAAVFVVGLHVDTLQLASTLYTDPTVRSAVVAVAEKNSCAPTPDDKTKQCLEQARDDVAAAGLPLGPPPGCTLGTRSGLGICLFGSEPKSDDDPTRVVAWGALPVTLLGLLLSVLAVTFGAPFWFQLLTRAASLRNTGGRPPSAAEPSAAPTVTVTLAAPVPAVPAPVPAVAAPVPGPAAPGAPAG